MELSVVRVHKAHSPNGRPGQRARLVVQPEKYLSQCPFILLAEDWFSPQGGFPTHPHKGIVTVTLVLDGSVKHMNDAGVQLHLDKGDAGFMTAGEGVLHGEMAGAQGAHVLRLWLNPPSALKSTEARYECLRLARVQSRALDGGTALVYAGKVDDVSAPFLGVWPLTLVRGNIAKNCRANFNKAYADLRTRQTAARGTAQRRRDVG